MSFFDKLKEKFTRKEDGGQYLSGFKKTKISFTEKLSRFAFGFKGVTDEFLEELMIVLLEGDVGIETADTICEQLKNKMKKTANPTFDETMDGLMEVMHDLYNAKKDPEIVLNEKGTTVILLVGVNGSGKTTSCAKLAKRYTEEGKSVAVVAADTFRAGAIDQLKTWAERLNVPCVAGKEGSDPSSVLVEGCRYAKEHQIDVLLCDTAGRLQNKVNLMKELAKMRKVVAREIEGAPHHVWLVLDSTTGQNGISQAKLFKEATEVTGMILTKMDGTAKGGIVLAIKHALSIPVYFIGLGEKADDLRPFDLDSYLYSMTEGLSSHD